MRSALRYTLLLAMVSSALSAQTAKKRVAVFDFDSAAAVQTTVMPFFQTSTPNVGKAVADLLLTRLVQDGIVNVIERSALDRLLAEQNLSNSNRTDPQSAAKLGRILGVDAVIVGSITHYDFDDKTTGGGASSVPFAGIGRNPMSTKHDMKARVQISARLVSPDTAEVLAVAEGNGEIVKKGVKVDMRDSRSVLNPSAAGDSLMSEAQDKAVAQLNESLKLNFAKVPPRAHVVDGLVADAKEGQLILNLGSRSGLKKGDRLQVWRSGTEIRDPATGKVLLRDDTLLGEATVTEVAEEFARASYQGSTPAKTGDVVKNPPAQR
jgi:curli biogenesis system outer membrane secretion channel CsgG